MDYGKCPSCQHELYDSTLDKCPFCGSRLPSGMGPGSSGGASQPARQTRVILVAALVLALLIGVLAAYLVSVQSGSDGKTDQNTVLEVEIPYC
jgi:hypothetical protein